MCNKTMDIFQFNKHLIHGEFPVDVHFFKTKQPNQKKNLRNFLKIKSFKQHSDFKYFHFKKNLQSQKLLIFKIFPQICTTIPDWKRY